MSIIKLTWHISSNSFFLNLQANFDVAKLYKNMTQTFALVCATIPKKHYTACLQCTICTFSSHTIIDLFYFVPNDFISQAQVVITRGEGKGQGMSKIPYFVKCLHFKVCMNHHYYVDEAYVVHHLGCQQLYQKISWEREGERLRDQMSFPRNSDHSQEIC